MRELAAMLSNSKINHLITIKMDTIQQTKTFAISDDEIEKIKNEELLRIAIKKELDPKQKKHPLWEFINSPFMLLLISGIFVTSFCNYLTRKSQETDNNTFLRKEAVKHFIELDYRITQVEIFLRGIDENPNDAFGRGYFMNRLI